MTDYKNIDAVNFSTLKFMDKSPLHYLHALKTERKDTSGMLKGRAVHTAVFEPDEFMRQYAVFKGKIRRGKEWEAFKSVHADDSILKLDEYNQALAIRDAVRRHPIARKLLEYGKAEQTITWTDPATGVKCKSRLDWYSDVVLADLKTTGSVDARWFGSQVAKMKYHVQSAMYYDGLAAAHGIRPPVKIIAVEANEPYDVAVFSVSEDDLAVGTETYQAWLRKLVDCRESGEWLGRYPDEEELSMPAYVFGDEDEVLTARVVEEGEEAS